MRKMIFTAAQAAILAITIAACGGDAGGITGRPVGAGVRWYSSD